MNLQTVSEWTRVLYSNQIHVHIRDGDAMPRHHSYGTEVTRSDVF
jgi:hypothetical protein